MMMTTKQPHEIGQLSKQTMNRMVALACVSVFVACVVSARMGLIDFFGPVMTVCLVSACSALVVLMTNRTTYLPFLGETVFPSPVLNHAREPADATVSVEVPALPGATHVVFWASDVGTGVSKNPWVAYKNYDNSGVVKVHDGKATLRLRCPARYTVRGKVLPRHVHYRSIFPSGIVGKVETRGIVCT